MLDASTDCFVYICHSSLRLPTLSARLIPPNQKYMLCTCWECQEFYWVPWSTILHRLPAQSWLADLLACLTWGRICKVCAWACVWRGFEWILLAEIRLFVKLNAWNPGQSRKLVRRHRAMRSKASLTARLIKWLKMNSACFGFVFTFYPLAETKQWLKFSEVKWKCIIEEEILQKWIWRKVFSWACFLQASM